MHSIAFENMGLVYSTACWAPPSPLMPEQASLFRSGVRLDSPLEGHSRWDLALITPGLARSTPLHCIAFYSILFYSILFYSILFYSILFYSILFYFHCRYWPCRHCMPSCRSTEEMFFMKPFEAAYKLSSPR